MRKDYPKIRFVRSGVIKSFKQTLYGREESYHYPPKKRGFYAFPKGFVEYFLVTNREPYHITQKSVWLRDEKGERFKVEGNYKPSEYYRGEQVLCDHWVSKEVLRQLKRKGLKKNWVDIAQPLEDSFVGLFRKLAHVPYDDIRLCYFKPLKTFRHFGYVWSHLHTFEGFPESLRRKNWIKGTWIKLTYGNYCFAFHKVTKALKEELWKEKHKDGNFDFQEYLCWNRKNWKTKLNKDCLEVFIEERRG